MRREWRFGGRSAASPSTCATADPGRIPPTVADAFVDRAPIDWTALLRRVRSSADRSLFESLRLLDQFRSPAAAGRPIAGTGFRIILVVRLMLALAAVQTACGLGALGVAFVNGSAVHPTSQVLLAAAFASACVLLRVISSDDRRSLFLVATFACAASAFTRAALTALPEPRPALVDLVFRGLVPEAFGPAALWQFAVDFPHVRRFTAFDRLARRAAAVAWLLGIVLFTVNLAGAYDAIDPWPAAVLRRDHPANLFWHLFVLAILPA